MPTTASETTDAALFVDVPTAARLLGVGLTTCWTMVRTGEIPSRRFRRCVRIPRAKIEQMAAEAAAAN